MTSLMTSFDEVSDFSRTSYHFIPNAYYVRLQFHVWHSIRIFFLEKLKLKNLKKHENSHEKNTFFCHMWRHSQLSKMFFEEFLSFPKLKKKIMRIGLLGKKLEGGVKLTPSLPWNRWENSPHEEGLTDKNTPKKSPKNTLKKAIKWSK